MIWLQFIISAVIILIAGIQLTKFADQLSDALCLGKLWIGVVLLGLITSLPEAGASMVSVSILKAGDLAVGNMAGSNNFNLLLIVLMDVVYQKGAVTNIIQYNKAQFFSAAFALGLAGVVILEIALSSVIRIPTFFGVSIGSLLLFVGYFAGMRCVYVNSERNCNLAGSSKSEARAFSLPKIYAGLIISAVFVVGAAVFLANAADVIAQATGWGRTFVGSLFLAFATSLPEMVVTLSALRMGHVDLAIGNIFGSNMTNMFLLSLCDPLVRGRALLQDVSMAHIFTLLTGFALTVVVLKGLKQSHKRKLWNMGWDSWTVLGIYILGVIGLYIMK